MNGNNIVGLNNQAIGQPKAIKAKIVRKTFWSPDSVLLDDAVNKFMEEIRLDVGNRAIQEIKDFATDKNFIAVVVYMEALDKE